MERFIQEIPTASQNPPIAQSFDGGCHRRRHERPVRRHCFRP